MCCFFLLLGCLHSYITKPKFVFAQYTYVLCCQLIAHVVQLRPVLALQVLCLLELLLDTLNGATMNEFSAAWPGLQAHNLHRCRPIVMTSILSPKGSCSPGTREARHRKPSRAVNASTSTVFPNLYSDRRRVLSSRRDASHRRCVRLSLLGHHRFLPQQHVHSRVSIKLLLQRACAQKGNCWYKRPIMAK